MTARWAYRIGQAGAARKAASCELDPSEALSHLSPELGRLFLAMAARDQRHALGVLRRLDGGGPLLYQAALLHDAGKAAAPLGTLGRSLVVLAQASGTLWLLRRLPAFGRRVSRYSDHAAIGAAMLRAAGADPTLVAIVAEHESPRPAHPETATLQAADDRE